MPTAYEVFEEIKNGKIGDVLDYFNIKLYEDFELVDYYKNIIDKMPQGNYFVSDVDGTFYRSLLIEFAVSKFLDFVKYTDITKLDIQFYKNFVEDVFYYKKLKKMAYNKLIDFLIYAEIGVFLINKYWKMINWADYMSFLREEMIVKMLANPYRFSLNMLKKVIDDGNYFLFVSAGSNFILDTYFEVLKVYLKSYFGEKYAKNVFLVSSYVGNENGLDDKVIYLWSKDQKRKIVEYIKNKGKIQKVIGGMGDNSNDFGLSWAIEDGYDFYFINPNFKVIQDFEKFKKQGINYKFIIERKNTIFEFDPLKVNFIDISI